MTLDYLRNTATLIRNNPLPPIPHDNFSPFETWSVAAQGISSFGHSGVIPFILDICGVFFSFFIVFGGVSMNERARDDLSAV